MIEDLKGKTVLITGAGTGIGAAAAKAFAAQGARAILHYNSSIGPVQSCANDIRAEGGDAFVIQGDLTQSGCAEAIIATITDQHGGLDILINNAGAMLGRVPTMEATDGHFDAVVRLNCWSLFAMTRASIPSLKKSSTPAIINVTSIAARNGGADGAVLYAAAKSFVSTLTRGMAKELAGNGIRVNAISPGVIDTPFHERDSTPAFLEAVKKSIPLGRIGLPEECAGTLLYLASAKLSGYVTGQIVEINGGQLMP